MRVMVFLAFSMYPRIAPADGRRRRGVGREGQPFGKEGFDVFGSFGGGFVAEGAGFEFGEDWLSLAILIADH